jgi:hydroxyacylglutathione hydrolase
MFIKQFYTKCLSEAAYYIESDGEAIVIDPMRDIEDFLKFAKKRNAKIKYVFETHFHADFISGHLELANATNSTIVFGPFAKANYNFYNAVDKEIFKIGSLKLKVIHTPGHTMESTSYLLYDENGIEYAVFTGDSLLLGDVGRPDLAVSSDLSKEDLACYLYDSIYEKLLKLNDNVIVYPGHGAGSQCGKNLSKERQCTIGLQKKTNYALQFSNRDCFVEAVLSGLTSPPQYFPKNALINKNGCNPLSKVLEESYKELKGKDFNAILANKDVIIIDSRSQEDFLKSHVKNAINVGLNGSFAVWVGTLINDLDTPLLVVADKGKEKETILRLARVGYENVKGFLSNTSMVSEDSEIEFKQSKTICSKKFNDLSDAVNVVDVSTINEYENGHVLGAINIPLANLLDNSIKLIKDIPYYVYCKSGYRSVIACSILEKMGFNNVVNVNKGYNSIMSSSLTCSCSAN